MVRRGLVLAALVIAAPAHADSPKLVEARRAVAAVDYDAARRLLVEALQDGDNSPAAMAEIYRLSARAAVVLEERELAEQYYRRWLAIDPDAALPGDTAPKLREPFIAAQAYIAAHGRLLARARHTDTGVDVEVLSDPLAMAHAAAAVDLRLRGPARPGMSAPDHPAATGPDRVPGPPRPSPAAFGGDHRVHLAAAARVAILDDHGNRLLELDPEPAELPVPPGPGDPAAAPPRPETPQRDNRWFYWAIPTGVFALGSAGFGIAALASYARAHDITDRSGQFFLSDAEADARRGRIFVWITAGAGAAAIGCAIPTAIYFLRGRSLGHLVLAPSAGPNHVGLVLGGRF